MVLVVIFCEFRRTCVSSIVTFIVMLVIAAATLEVTMDISFIDVIDEILLLIIELFLPIRIFGRQTELLKFVQICYRALISLLNVACLNQVYEELLDEVNGRGFREQRIGVDKDNIVSEIF